MSSAAAVTKTAEATTRGVFRLHRIAIRFCLRRSARRRAHARAGATPLRKAEDVGGRSTPRGSNPIGAASRRVTPITEAGAVRALDKCRAHAVLALTEGDPLQIACVRAARLLHFRREFNVRSKAEARSALPCTRQPVPPISPAAAAALAAIHHRERAPRG